MCRCFIIILLIFLRTFSLLKSFTFKKKYFKEKSFGLVKIVHIYGSIILLKQCTNNPILTREALIIYYVLINKPSSLRNIIDRFLHTVFNFALYIYC